MSVLLVRHAKAGDREKWDAPDDLRPLTGKGEAQAGALVDLLAGYEIDRVLSSPYLRCTQTVAPLAAARGLAVEPCDDLAEGEGQAGISLTRRLLSHDHHTVLCSHGDVVEEILDALGVPRDDFTRKGATWVLDEVGALRLEAP
ncbi:MAG TPA: phosphoglycerate mutase family protein [Acidimicrobiales bacterium]|nr:phosphoglycerate mutase family protein [Acidimicrobiales bacterium]HWI04258.1 phosphoglycerate mutase family protein [Acidimicrobiales bacterium]